MAEQDTYAGSPGWDGVRRLTKEWLETFDEPLLCESCGKPMAEHDRLAQCHGASSD